MATQQTRLQENKSKMKIIILILFSLSIFGNSLQSKDNIPFNCHEDSIQHASKEFVYAITTKDTTKFFSLVEKTELCHNLNLWIKDNKPYDDNDIFFPFFFVFSPIKIRAEDLIKMRNNIKHIKKFRFKIKRQADNWKVWITWLDENNKSKKLLLVLNKECKIIDSRWKTL